MKNTYTKPVLLDDKGEQSRYKWVNPNTKQAQSMRDDYLYEWGTLEQHYAKPSITKQRAYQNCIKKALNNGAECYGVVSHSTDFFVFMFTFKDFDGVIYIVKETHLNTYLTIL